MASNVIFSISLQPQHQEKCAQVAAQLQALASKAEEMQLDKIFVRVFRPDRSTKAMLIDRSMRVGQLCDIMTEKNFLSPSIRLSLVERVFSMKMGTCEVKGALGRYLGAMGAPGVRVYTRILLQYPSE